MSQQRSKQALNAVRAEIALFVAGQRRDRIRPRIVDVHQHLHAQGIRQAPAVTARMVQGLVFCDDLPGNWFDASHLELLTKWPRIRLEEVCPTLVEVRARLSLLAPARSWGRGLARSPIKSLGWAGEGRERILVCYSSADERAELCAVIEAALPDLDLDHAAPDCGEPWRGAPDSLKEAR